MNDLSRDSAIKDAIASVEMEVFLNEAMTNEEFSDALISKDRPKVLSGLAQIGLIFPSPKTALDAILAIDWSDLKNLSNRSTFRMG